MSGIRVLGGPVFREARLAPCQRANEIQRSLWEHQSSNTFRGDPGSMVGYSPNGKLRPVRYPELSKDPIQVLLDSAFREM
jgi:hypothetical protein